MKNRDAVILLLLGILLCPAACSARKRGPGVRMYDVDSQHTGVYDTKALTA